MRKIVDKAVYYAEFNETNKRLLIKDFITEKKAQGRSRMTLEQYENDLRIIAFLVYKHFGNVAFYELTRKDIHNLSIMFQEMGMSNARVNRLLSALRSLLEFCADDDDYDYEYNVGSRVKGLPRNPFREITFLTDEQIEWLIDTLVKDKKISHGRLLGAIVLQRSMKERGSPSIKRRANGAVFYQCGHRKRQ